MRPHPQAPSQLRQYGGPWPTAPQMQLPSGPRQGAWVQATWRAVRTFSLLAAMRLLIDVDGKVGVVESVAS